MAYPQRDELQHNMSTKCKDALGYDGESIEFSRSIPLTDLPIGWSEPAQTRN